jgi:hypothetical protein
MISALSGLFICNITSEIRRRAFQRSHLIDLLCVTAGL